MEGEGKDRLYLIKEEGLRELFEELKKSYRMVAPSVKDGIILYDQVETFEDLPFGYRNVEFAGSYQLQKAEGYFTYTHPANSVKSFLHPSELVLLRVFKGDGGLKFETAIPDNELCFFDVRACDLSAVRILDEVFLNQNPHPDPFYSGLRKGAFIVAVNCGYATSTCFCTTMGTGPEVKGGYDLLLTELNDGFLVEVGSERGQRVLQSINGKKEATEEHLSEKLRILERTEGMMKVYFERDGLAEKLYDSMDDSRWDYIEKRCLACTSCTQSCPTCFCFDILEKNTLGGESERVRVWDSCFSPAFATVHRFNIRQSIHSRYRQWLMHKFAYWTEQFGTFGCVGCGRCITWCPVGIDIREEVATVGK